MSIADYAGRTIDVLAFQGPAVPGPVLLRQQLADPGQGGMICTGIQKLTQRFVLEFLTELGSLPYLPRRGTTFMLEMRQGRLRTELDVMQAFSAAMADLNISLRSEDDEHTEPADERFESAALIGIEISPGQLSLKVNVISKAGTDRKVILPIAVLA